MSSRNYSPPKKGRSDEATKIKKTKRQLYSSDTIYYYRNIICYSDELWPKTKDQEASLTCRYVQVGGVRAIDAHLA